MHKHYVIPLMALENHVLTPFGPYLALIDQVQANRGWKFDI